MMTVSPKINAWLPEGTWTDIFSGDRYVGGRMMNLYRSSDNIPVLARAGSILPMDAAEIPENGAALPETILFKVFPGKDGETVLIEDNGLLPEATGYCQAVTRVTLSHTEGLSIRISPVDGDMSLLPINRGYVIELYGFGDIAPDAVDCELETAYDQVRRVLRLTLKADVAKGATVYWPKEVPAPEIPWIERLYQLLMPAALPYDQKDDILRMAQQSTDHMTFMRQLHTQPIPAALAGAIQELLTIQRT